MSATLALLSSAAAEEGTKGTREEKGDESSAHRYMWPEIRRCNLGYGGLTPLHGYIYERGRFLLGTPVDAPTVDEFLNFLNAATHCGKPVDKDGDLLDDLFKKGADECEPFINVFCSAFVEFEEDGCIPIVHPHLSDAWTAFMFCTGLAAAKNRQYTLRVTDDWYGTLLKRQQKTAADATTGGEPPFLSSRSVRMQQICMPRITEELSHLYVFSEARRKKISAAVASKRQENSRPALDILGYPPGYLNRGMELNSYLYWYEELRPVEMARAAAAAAVPTAYRKM